MLTSVVRLRQSWRMRCAANNEPQRYTRFFERSSAFIKINILSVRFNLFIIVAIVVAFAGFAYSRIPNSDTVYFSYEKHPEPQRTNPRSNPHNHAPPNHPPPPHPPHPHSRLPTTPTPTTRPTNPPKPPTQPPRYPPPQRHRPRPRRCDRWRGRRHQRHRIREPGLSRQRQELGGGGPAWE